MARFSLGLLASGAAALLTLGATFGPPGEEGPAQGLQAELSELAWARGDDTLRAARVQVDLATRTAVTSLSGTVGGAAIQIPLLRLGQRETSFEHLRASGSLSPRALGGLQVERLDLRHAELLRLAGLQETAPAAAAVAAVPGPAGLTLEVARGGVRLGVSGVAWLEGLRLVNHRGDQLTIEAISISVGGEAWTCDGVSLTQAGVERTFERLIFLAPELTLVEPQTLAGRLEARPPELVLDLGRWE